VGALQPDVELVDVELSDPLGGRLRAPAAAGWPLPQVLQPGEPLLCLAFVMDMTAPERAGGRSLVPCEGLARVRLPGGFEAAATWSLPILIRRARTVRLNLDESSSAAALELAPPVDKVRVGYVWSDGEEEAEAQEHPSLLMIGDDDAAADGLDVVDGNHRDAAAE
jgi:hypothetical protein